MTRQEKHDAIENLKEALVSVKTLYLADIAGIRCQANKRVKTCLF